MSASTLAACVVVILLAAGSAIAQEVSPATITAVKRAILPVTCGSLDSSNRFQVTQIVATGFLINRRGDFVTASHVVEDLAKFANQNRCFGATYLAFDSSASAPVVETKWYRIRSCRANQQQDTAVCSLVQNPFEDATWRGRLAVLRFDSVFRHDDGTAVAFTGFPLEYSRPLTSKGYIASRYPEELVLDKTAWPGASGSPVYSANGSVVGVLLKRGLGIAAGLAYARPADIVTSFLAKENIPFERQDDGRQTR